MNHKRVSIQHALAGCRICAAAYIMQIEDPGYRNTMLSWLDIAHDKDVIKGRLEEVVG